MALDIRDLVLPPSQRRSLEELSGDLDLRSGDRSAKLSAFWTMLVLAAVIATAGILGDSTATVIGAMIIAPLSTPIMGIALGIVTRERNRAVLFVALGAVIVVLIGYLVALLVPGGTDVAHNSQIAARTSPKLLDLGAAIATGLAGAVALARRDVAAVVPGVAIAISLVPPLAVVGVCLADGERLLALGALLLFLSNLVALVISGTLLFASLGYAVEADRQPGLRTGPRRRSSLALTALLVAVLIPLAVNTALVYALHGYSIAVEQAGRRWVSQIPGATVTGVDASWRGFTLNVRSPAELPPVSQLTGDLADELPTGLPVTVVTTQGRTIEGPRPAG